MQAYLLPLLSVSCNQQGGPDEICAFGNAAIMVSTGAWAKTCDTSAKTGDSKMPTPIENADCIDTLVDRAVNDTSHAFLVDAAVRMKRRRRDGQDSGEGCVWRQ